MNGIPAVPWWAEIDRFALKQACSSHADSNGLLLVTGDGLSGREEAARLACRALAVDGREVVQAAAPIGGVKLLRQLVRSLIAAVKQVHGHTPGAIGLDAAMAGASEDLLIDLLVSTAGPLANTSGLAVVVTGLAVDTKPHESDLMRLRGLADRLGAPWVVVGGRTAPWNALQAERHLRLGNFERHEVAAVLRQAETDGTLTRPVSDKIMSDLFTGRRRTVRPATAYAALQRAVW